MNGLDRYYGFTAWSVDYLNSCRQGTARVFPPHEDKARFGRCGFAATTVGRRFMRFTGVFAPRSSPILEFVDCMLSSSGWKPECLLLRDRPLSASFVKAMRSGVMDHRRISSHATPPVTRAKYHSRSVASSPSPLPRSACASVAASSASSAIWSLSRCWRLVSACSSLPSV